MRTKLENLATVYIYISTIKKTKKYIYGIQEYIIKNKGHPLLI